MASGNLPPNMETSHFGHPAKTSTNKSSTQDFINSEMIKLQNEAGLVAQSTIQMEPPTIDEQGSKEASTTNNPPKQGLSMNSNTVIVRKRSDYQTLVSPVGDDAANNRRNSPETKMKDPDLSIDDNLPETVTLLKTPEGGKCYLIGTAHFSLESQNDVSRIIQAVQPHIIMVELCLDRIHVLQLDEETILEEAKNLSFSKITSTIKEHGVHRGLFYLLLLNMSAYLTKVLGLAPGGEFRRAFQEAKKVPHCILQMGDRPIGITFARALSSLSWWQTAKLTWHLLTERDNLLSQKDIEEFKSRDALEEMMAELAGEYPAVEEVFVKERDLFLTYSLQTACKPKVGPDGRPIIPRVVGVVGIGHTIGIIEHWGKVQKSQIPPILHVPPPSLSSKILAFTFKACILGSGIFIGYKVVKVTPSIVNSLKSSVEGLIKASVGK
ncbi:hypothetical protein QAD02_009821 [Eretmocerus hayati]|uniref:Uncharacterized protein n=1 Tax=Eretmocerus hayati TaxID=131215 RepID=A0ACC2NB54_9HYME|nr:hypothetical protein QAD02_009821 [Eretmocerus hayati]